MTTRLQPRERALLNRYQRDLPLSREPFREMGERCGFTEAELLDLLARWRESRVLSRVGAVLEHRSVGASTLAALSVPQERLDEVAACVSAHPEVNHNYEREHDYNLWFVVTAEDRGRVDAVLAEIEARTGLTPLDLPMERSYCVDTAFAL